MKKIILILMAVISLSVTAQHLSLSLNLSPEQLHQSTQAPVLAMAATPDGFLMKDGSMMMVSGGKTTPMVRDVTLSNGTKVMKTGSYMPKGGMKMMLKEGEQIDMDGNLIPSNSMDKSMDTKTMPEKDMNMPDTTKTKENLKY